VKKRLVFTNHTPEEAGNPKTDIGLLDKMGFFCDVPQTEIRAITQIGDHELDYTLSALRLSGKAMSILCTGDFKRMVDWIFVKSLRLPPQN
jgi:starch phosphorylase